MFPVIDDDFCHVRKPCRDTPQGHTKHSLKPYHSKQPGEARGKQKVSSFNTGDKSLIMQTVAS